MKVGVLIDRLNVGGVEKIAIEEVNALRLIGEDAYLLCLREKAVVENAFPDLLKDTPIIYLDQRLPKALRFSFQFPVFHFFSSFHITYPFFIPFVFKKNEFDYLIVHSSYTAFSAITIRRVTHIPYSVFIWDPIDYILGRVYSKKFNTLLFKFLHSIASFLDKQIVDNADAILVGGDAHNAYFKKLSPHKKVVIIPPSVHPLKTIESKKEKYLLLVTAWKKGKNPEYIFELMKRFNKLRVIMAGKWLDKNEFLSFRNKVKKNGYEKQIIITGELSEKQLSLYYKKALFLLQINDDRGFGLPALEAAGHGTTFIIPKGQGVCNLFKDKTDGFFVKEHDTESILTYIQKLYNHELSAKKMGKSAWEKVVKKYSWRQHAIQLRQIIKKYGLSR